MIWVNPVPYKLVPTEDSESFNRMKAFETGLPMGNHVGAFGVTRKHHIHEGIDLYVGAGCPITAVEAGEVVDIIPFTGASVGSDWWNETKAILVEGESGVVLYGEVAPHIAVGTKVTARTLLGVVVKVLRKDKGRPMSMLHLELHSHGSREAPIWYVGEPKPKLLKDPTFYLCEIVDNF